MPIDKNNGALWTLGAAGLLALAGAVKQRGSRSITTGDDGFPPGWPREFIEPLTMASKSYTVTEDPHGGRFTHRSPLEWLKSQPSVIDGEYVDMTSSGGSWGGWFAEKVGGHGGPFVMVIPFLQEFEIAPGGGAIIDTFRPLFGFPMRRIDKDDWRERAEREFYAIQNR